MLEPLDNRSSPNRNGVHQAGPALPSPPPGLPSRSALRPLRVLPSPEEGPGNELSGSPDRPATGGSLQLRRELEAARNELNALQDMLEELPAILERKFQQQLQGLLEQQRVLIARNQSLRERLLTLAPSPAPATLPVGAATGLVDGFRRTLRRALGSPDQA